MHFHPLYFWGTQIFFLKENAVTLLEEWRLEVDNGMFRESR